MSSAVIHSNMSLAPERVNAAFEKAAEKQVRKALLLIEGDIRRLTPFRTGTLRRSITSHVARTGSIITGTVGTVIFYGLYLEEGTGLFGPLHRKIVPTRAQALRWPAGGGAGTAGPGFTLAGRRRSGKAGANAQYMFRRSVKGIRPRRFFEAGVLAGRAHWDREIALIPTVARAELGLAA